MDTSPPVPSEQRPTPDGGRVATPEIAELLQLRRRPAAVVAAAVVLLGLLLALVLPGVLPANALVGAVVGLLAVVGGVAAAVAVDGRDPVLRGPRHLRRDGHTVLARMASSDVELHGAAVLEALERRLEGTDRLRVVVTGTGADASELAAALGRGAAAHDHTSLVIDLRAPGVPGVAEVGAGTVRLGEAARLADDRPYAWIGAGLDRTAAVQAAVGVAQRPPRDLNLLLIVAPDVATRAPELLEACERTIVLVAADTEPRAMVTARLEALRRAGARPEAVVVGGAAVAAATTSLPDARPSPFSPSVAVVADDRDAHVTQTLDAPVETPAAAGTADAEAEPQAADVEAEPHAADVEVEAEMHAADVGVAPETPLGDAEVEADVESDADAATHAADVDVSTPHVDAPAPVEDSDVAPAAPPSLGATPAAPAAPPAAASPSPDPDPLPPPPADRSDRSAPSESSWDLRSIGPGTASAAAPGRGRAAVSQVGDVELSGMSAPDALSTAAALDALSERARGEGA